MSETSAPFGKVRQFFHWRNSIAWLVLALALLVQLALLNHLQMKEERARSEERR